MSEVRDGNDDGVDAEAVGGVGTNPLSTVNANAIFKDMPVHVLCVFKVEKGEDVAVCEKQMLMIKDNEEVSYEEDYIILWPGKNKGALERHACKLLLFHEEVAVLNDLAVKYTDSEIELEDITNIRENPLMLNTITKQNQLVSKSGRPRKVTPKLMEIQQNKDVKKRGNKEKDEDKVKNLSKKALEKARSESLLADVKEFAKKSKNNKENESVDDDSMSVLEDSIEESPAVQKPEISAVSSASNNKDGMKRVADLTLVPVSPKKRRAELLEESRKALAAVKQDCSEKIKKTLLPTTSTKAKANLLVDGCSFKEITNKEICLTCELLNDKIKVMEKRISIWETLSNLERMQTYLSMVVIQDEAARGLPDNPKMDIEHCPPFCEESNGTRPTSPEIPKPLPGATAKTDSLDSSIDSEDEGPDDDQDKPKQITETIIKSLRNQTKMSLFVGELMMKIFTNKYMQTHQMTSKAGLGAKKAMKEKDLTQLIAAVQNVFKTATDLEVRTAIRLKLNNVCKKAKTDEMRAALIASSRVGGV